MKCQRLVLMAVVDEMAWPHKHVCILTKNVGHWTNTTSGMDDRGVVSRYKGRIRLARRGAVRWMSNVNPAPRPSASDVSRIAYPRCTR
jgi:hypothetical protein